MRTPILAQRMGSDTFWRMVLLALWLAAVLIAYPVGNFPLNDDWCYARSVKHLLDHGEIRFLQWGSPTLLAQVLWGALFCLPFGFSFHALRLSTLVLAAIGLWFTHRTFRDIGIERRFALAGTLLVAFNPMFFSLSSTFMTDVPFIAPAALSVFFYLRSIRQGSSRDLVVATLWAAAATLTRQIGLFLPIAHAVANWAHRRERGEPLTRAALLKALGPVVCIVGLLVLYIGALNRVGEAQGASWSHSLHMQPIRKTLQGDSYGTTLPILGNVFMILAYLGLFIGPAFLLNRQRPLPDGLRWACAASWLAFGLLAVDQIGLQRTLMPFTDNIAYNCRIGPATLRDIYISRKPHLPTLPPWVWIAVTAMALAGAFALLRACLAALACFKRGRAASASDTSPQVFSLTSLILLSTPLVVLNYFFDRYVIVLLPFALILALTPPSTAPRPLSRWLAVLVIVLSLPIALFAIAGTHDYFAWNRARWTALNRLTDQENISPRRIDGGFEFNGWYLYGDVATPTNGKSFWWVDKDDYLVTFGVYREKTYATYDRVEYQAWLPPGVRHIYVLKRRPGDPSSTNTPSEEL